MPNRQHMKTMEALMKEALPGETIEFNKASDVSNFVLEKHKQGLQYFGKNDLDDGTHILYFATKSK